jgi:hypothetical protein
MNQLICDAIKNKQRLQFNYNTKIRVVEPQCYGIGYKGSELLRAYEVEGDVKKSNKLYTLLDTSSLVALQQFFTEPGPNYRKGDKAMKTIFCEL